MPYHDSVKTQLANTRILLVDDDETLDWEIEKKLRAHGADILKVQTINAAKNKFQFYHPDIIITNQCLSDGDAFHFIKHIKSLDSAIPFILLKDQITVDSALSALRLGVFDFLQKPLNLHTLAAAVRRASEVSILRQKINKHTKDGRRSTPPMIGSSPSMLELRNRIEKIAISKSDTVLILGASGVGKELAAHMIHDLSEYANNPFVEVNCASIPETLLESELFGHERGAFTDARERKAGLFEIAQNGSIFLDEIGELPLKLQAKLLRVLEHRRFKRLGGTKDIELQARIITATNRELAQEVQNGKFRPDLFYRLNVLPLTIKDLRERKEDIPELVNALIERLCQQLEIEVPKISKKAMKLLQNHDWPGNVRELKNLLHRALIFHQPPELLPEHIEFDAIAFQEISGAVSAQSSDSLINFPDGGISLEEVEKHLLLHALEKAKYNQTKAADLLKISRHTLRYRLEKFNL